MNKLVKLLVISLLCTPLFAVAHDDPKTLECANIERAFEFQKRALKIHLEREMPTEVAVEQINLLTLMLAGLGGVRDFDGAMHEASTQAYQNEIKEMHSRGKERSCPWAS
jgi:hypothetical protein